MTISNSNQCSASAADRPAGFECATGAAPGNGAASAARPTTVNDAWESLGMRMRRYIIMQHGQIDLDSARDASEMPWAAVRGAIEGVNDEFDGDAAEAAVLATAGRSGGGRR